MAKGDWWFKFEWEDWLGDDELSACSLETQGFWIRCVSFMYRADSDRLVGSIDDLRRRLGILPDELTRCAQDLKRTNAADVTFSNGEVTIVSRRRTRELESKQKNTVKVANWREKKRGNRDVTEETPDRDRVKSLKLKPEKNKKEEVRASPAKRGTRIPTDFAVTEPMFAWAKVHAPNVPVSIETEKFRDHWISAVKNAVKIDWSAAWRLWMRNAQDWNPRANNGPDPRTTPFDEREFKRRLESQDQTGKQ